MTVFDMFDKYHNNWVKKHEGEWTWVTVSFNQRSKEMYFYVNDELVTNVNNVKENKPFLIGESLKKHDNTNPFILGFCSNQKTYFKGKIAEVKIFNKFIEDINEVFEDDTNLVMNVSFNDYRITEEVNNIKCDQQNITSANYGVNNG